MGWIAKVISFAREVRRQSANVNVVRGDPGAGANATMEHFSASGDDSPPLAGDYVAGLPLQRSGGLAAVGVADPRNAGVAEPGEKRIYARDTSGAVVAEIYIEADGTITLSNAAGSLILDVSGNLTATGTITAADFIAGGVPFATHVHGGVQSGGSNTGVPL